MLRQYRSDLADLSPLFSQRLIKTSLFGNSGEITEWFWRAIWNTAQSIHYIGL